MRRTRGLIWPVAAAVLALAAGACGTSDNPKARGAGPPAEQPRRGGTLVVGASGEPACADWYGCGSFFWGYRAMALQTLPTPMDFLDGAYRPSPLLAGEPTVDPGPPQRVTYRINSKAVWSDGAAITSADFKYSWEQAKAANFGGAGDIAAVDDSDPTTPVVTWNAPSASWRDRFRPILPKHLLDGKDRNAEMKDGYRFSGGPWMIDHWTRGQEVKLVRNPMYWGKPANFDAVVFKIIPDSAAYQQAYKTGQVDMIFLSAAPTESVALKGLPTTLFEAAPSLAYSMFIFNTQKPPLDSRAVRQALAYATDRQAIVKQLFGTLQPDVHPTQAVMSPANRQWYSEPFARYRRDLSKVNELMGSDGWTRGADGVWAKGDVRARVEVSASSGSRINDLTTQILQSQWQEAGFDTTVKAVPSSTLLGDAVTKGNYQVVLTSWAPGSTDPDLCNFYCTRGTPIDANRFQGQNASRISTPALDHVWAQVNTELDPVKRHELVRRGQEALADEVPVLPLAGLLDVFVSNNAKVGGPVASTPAFLRLSEWFCRATCG